MPLKEWLIKKLSQRLSVNQKVIEIVVNEQFTEAFKQTSTSNSIDFSGWGRLVFLPVKANKQYKEYERVAEYFNSQSGLSEEDECRRVLKLKNLNRSMEHLKPKLR